MNTRKILIIAIIFLSILLLIAISIIVYLLINQDSESKSEESEEPEEISQTVTRDSSIPFFGIEEEFNNENDLSSLTIEQLRSLNPGFIRTLSGPFFWDWIEPTNGDFDFSLTDNVVSKAYDADVGILVTLWPYAEWDQEGLDECIDPKSSEGEQKEDPEKTEELEEYEEPIHKCKPQNVAEYREFLEEIVERYDGDSDFGNYPISSGLKEKIKSNPVKYWEISNEVDETLFFVGSLSDYTELLMNSYDFIHNVCDDCKVVISAPKTDIDGFYNSILDLNARDYFDVYNLHVPAIDPLGDLKKAVSSIDKPVFITETGGGNGFDMSRQAITHASEGATSAFLCKAPDKMKYQHYIASEDGGNSEQFFEGYLLDENGEENDMFRAYKTLVEELEFFNKIETYNTESDLKKYKFYFDDRASCYVYFIGGYSQEDLEEKGDTIQGTKSFQIEVDFEEYSVKDIYGNSYPNSEVVKVEEENVYIVRELAK